MNCAGTSRRWSASSRTPTLPLREPAEFLNATKNYSELREALASAEDDWLGLEILREELERQ